MFFVFKRPFGSPNAVIYSYEVSKLFLKEEVTSVLEVGCGIGMFAFRYAAARKNVFVMGVDQSTATIDYLNANYKSHYKNLELLGCDFCEKELDLGKRFDEVYSSDVIEHVTDPRTFVDNIHRHLKVGGRAVVNFPNESNHGINHFSDVTDVLSLFSVFRDVRVFTVHIRHPANTLWFKVRAAYESIFSRATKEARNHLYSEREEQGIDHFEESTCFRFINESGRLKSALASVLAEVFLMIKPSIRAQEVERGNILNTPRLVAVAAK